MQIFRNPTGSMRTLNIAVLLFFMTSLYAPSALAIKTGNLLGHQDGVGGGLHQSTIDTAAYSGQLDRMKGHFIKAESIYRDQQDSLIGQTTDIERAIKEGKSIFRSNEDLWKKEIESALALYSAISESHDDVINGFESEFKWVKENEFSETILQRHETAELKYKSSFDQLKSLVKPVVAANDDEQKIEALRLLNKSIEKWKFSNSESDINVDQLPWSSGDSLKTREPAKDIEELFEVTSLIPFSAGPLLASNTLPANIFEMAGGPVPQDIEETEDIQITPIFVGLAEEFEYDPVKIYEWVRNNIEFIPTYGSIQGSDYTLRTKKGNAFDISSLLIALYRSSNIPARYSYGVIEVPSERAMNWVGGVNDVSAAQQILGQGGIPNKGIRRAGKIESIQMEHVWVEAWVDYFPSRGAKHRLGDSWVALDPSYKQYEYESKKFDFNQVQYNGKDYLESLGSGWDWPSGFDNQRADDAFDSLDEAIDTLLSTALLDEDQDEIFGNKKLIIKEYGILASGLSNRVVNKTSNFSELPDSLRHKFRYILKTEFSSEVLRHQVSLPSLRGADFSIGFKPATEEDKNVIVKRLPSSPDSTIADLPKNFPSYLISLTAEFKQDNETVKAGGNFKLGSDVVHSTSLFSPQNGWRERNIVGVAGEYRAIGLDFGGVDEIDAEAVKAKLVTALDAVEFDGQQNITETNFVDDLMRFGIKYYFALLNASNSQHALESDIVQYRLPSYGYFHTNVETQFYFGIPRFASFSGVTMDIPLINFTSVSKNNSNTERLDFNRHMGTRASFLEGTVPQILFFTGDEPGQGVSAAQALELALSAGQNIYTITRDNASGLNNISIDAESRQVIRNAIAVGKEVTVHESPVTVGNWSGTGYFVLDPVLGDGAYLISGVANGGFLGIEESTWLSMLSLGIDFIPGVGSVKAIIELITGKDLITGQPINRWIVSIALLASFVGGAAAVKGLAKAGDKLAKAGKSSNAIGQAGEAAVNVAKRAVLPGLKVLSRKQLTFTAPSGAVRIADGATDEISKLPRLLWEVKNVATLTGKKIQNQIDDYLMYCAARTPKCDFELFIRGPSNAKPTHITSGMKKFLCDNKVLVIAIEEAELGIPLDIKCP